MIKVDKSIMNRSATGSKNGSITHLLMAIRIKEFRLSISRLLDLLQIPLQTVSGAMTLQFSHINEKYDDYRDQ